MSQRNLQLAASAAAFFLSLIAFSPASHGQDYNKEYGSTAGDYPNPPVDRKDFAPLKFIEAADHTAIFTEVMTEPHLIESVKEIIRSKLPNAHVRRIIAGADDTDQTLMVMWHPKEAFRPAINDYFRVIDFVPGVKGTRTYVGASDKFPESFPGDTLIGWAFVKFQPAARIGKLASLEAGLLSDPDVLEVAQLTGGSFDMVVVYRFSGASVLALREVKDRLQNLIGIDGIETFRWRECP